MLYLDTLASYPMLPEAHDAFLKASIELFANPSANHACGEDAMTAINDVRAQIADSVGALPSEIIFTSGATESNNLIIKGSVLPLLQAGKRPHIITSVIEHKCILTICGYLESLGCEVTYLKPIPMGIITPESVESAIQENTVLCSIMHVNNELGTLNPISEIGAICNRHHVLFHSDAAQSYQKTGIDVDDMNIDMLSLSAHKIGGPKGIGAAYIRDLRTSPIEPVIHGAGHEFGLRGGTLATPLILAFGAATASFAKSYDPVLMQSAKAHLVKALERNNIEFKINGGDQALPSCINLSLLNVDAEAMIRSTRDRYCLSQGSACTSGSIEPSHVLQALGISREMASKTLRLSFPINIEFAQIDSLVQSFCDFKK